MQKRSKPSTGDSTLQLGDPATGAAPTNGAAPVDVPAVPDFPPPSPAEIAALGDWCAYTRIMYNRLSMSQSPYADFMADMLSIFEPLIDSAKGAQP